MSVYSIIGGAGFSVTPAALAVHAAVLAAKIACRREERGGNDFRERSPAGRMSPDEILAAGAFRQTETAKPGRRQGRSPQKKQRPGVRLGNGDTEGTGDPEDNLAGSRATGRAKGGNLYK